MSVAVMDLSAIGSVVPALIAVVGFVISEFRIRKIEKRVRQDAIETAKQKRADFVKRLLGRLRDRNDSEIEPLLDEMSISFFEYSDALVVGIREILARRSEFHSISFLQRNELNSFVCSWIDDASVDFELSFEVIKRLELSMSVHHVCSEVKDALAEFRRKKYDVFYSKRDEIIANQKREFDDTKGGVVLSEERDAEISELHQDIDNSELGVLVNRLTSLEGELSAIENQGVRTMSEADLDVLFEQTSCVWETVRSFPEYGPKETIESNEGIRVVTPPPAYVYKYVRAYLGLPCPQEPTYPLLEI